MKQKRMGNSLSDIFEKPKAHYKAAKLVLKLGCLIAKVHYSKIACRPQIIDICRESLGNDIKSVQKIPPNLQCWRGNHSVDEKASVSNIAVR